MQICASYGVSTPYGIDTAAADIQSGAGQRSIHSWLIRILLETDYAINSQLDPLRALVEICYARIFTVEFLIRKCPSQPGKYILVSPLARLVAPSMARHGHRHRGVELYFWTI